MATHKGEIYKNEYSVKILLYLFQIPGGTVLIAVSEGKLNVDLF